jgi:hypothetical protein
MTHIPTIAWNGCGELQTLQNAQTQDSKSLAFPRIIRQSMNLQTHVIRSLLTIYLFIYNLFNNTVSNSEYTVLNGGND